MAVDMDHLEECMIRFGVVQVFTIQDLECHLGLTAGEALIGQQVLAILFSMILFSTILSGALPLAIDEDLPMVTVDLGEVIEMGFMMDIDKVIIMGFIMADFMEMKITFPEGQDLIAAVLEL